MVATMRDLCPEEVVGFALLVGLSVSLVSHAYLSWPTVTGMDHFAITELAPASILHLHRPDRAPPEMTASAGRR